MPSKIELKEPFSSRWKYGYLVINKEPRRNVILYNSHADRTTISYAKYLYCVHNNTLEVNGVVDHINNDKMDDRIENYQVISYKENSIKSIIFQNKTRLVVQIRCGVCSDIFVRDKRNTHLINKSKRSTYCSRKCGSINVKPLSEIISEYRE